MQRNIVLKLVQKSRKLARKCGANKIYSLLKLEKNNNFNQG